MKAKRFLSLMLSLTLAVSLAAPALAAEELLLPEVENDIIITTLPDLTPAAPDEEPAEEVNEYAAFLEEFCAQYTAEHPEEYAAFDPHAWWAEDWGEYWDSEEEYIDYNVVYGYWDSADQFAEKMWMSYLGRKADEAWYAKQVEDYRAAHPGELEALTQEQLLAWLGYTETLTPTEQFMEDYTWAVEEEGDVLPYLLQNYVTDRNYVAETHETFLTNQAQYPEKWAEFDVEAFFEEEYGYWTDNSKEIYMATRHLFTEEEFVERMFTNYVEYNSWEWDNDYDWDYDWDHDWDYNYGSDKPLRLVVNGQVMEGADISAADGWSYIAPATANSVLGTHYVEDGAMLPLRSTVEAEGWDVGWNEYENAIFLIDKQAATERIQKSFTALDEVMAWAMEHNRLEPGKSYKTTETLDVTLTTLNSLDGDTDYTVRVTLEAIQKDGAVELTVKVNAADVLKLIGDDILKLAADEIPQLSLSDLPTLMKGLELNAIVDLDSGKLYWNVPVLSVFDDTVKPDTWYGADFGMGLDEALAGMGTDLETLVGGLSSYLADYIYEEQLLFDSALRWNTPESAWEQFDTMVATLDAVMGPDRVSKSGGKLTWKVDTKTMNDLFAQMSGVEAAPFKSYELSYVMGGDGTFSADMTMRPDFQAMMRAAMDDYYSYDYSVYDLVSILSGRVLSLFEFQVTAHSSGSMDKATGTMEYHQKNTFKLKLDTETDRVEVKDGPALTPPEGADVIMVLDLSTELLANFL